MNTSGIHLHTKSRWLREWVELLSSMRFAISALVMVALASVIGTILKQNEPFINYVDQFGAFWFEVFKAASLNNVYTAWWFLLIMGLLLVSTSLCVIRNTPKMLHEMRTFRDHVRINGLRALPQHSEFVVTGERAALAARLQRLLQQHGLQTRIDVREQTTLIAAKSGSASRWGYVLAHSAIVVICLGGLVDSGLPVKLQVALQGKQPIRGNALIRDIPASGYLSSSNPTFRGNTLLAEGQSSDQAIVSYDDGMLLQPLPFEIALKKFSIDFYSTGMPRAFVSEVEITDKDNGQKFPATIKVNQPLIYKGIAVYQSSFEDGGSHLTLKSYPMRGASDAVAQIKGDVGGSAALGDGSEKYNIEFTGFRAINVEQFAEADISKNKPAASVFSSASKVHADRQQKNIGPSVQYKVRDASGQAREYHNYMLPAEIDGHLWYLTGMRERPGEPFQYLRIPADAEGTVAEFMRLRAALANPRLRALAAQRAASAVQFSEPAKAAEMRAQWNASVTRMLGIFSSGGFEAVARFVLDNIPAAEQPKAVRLLMQVLTDGSWYVWQEARRDAHLPELPRNEANRDFLERALNAASDSFFYGAPMYLQLDGFEEVKASVFQLTRSPGKKAVYLGSLMLVLGIFAMFYIRERRVWAAVTTQPDGSQSVLLAMSMTRKTMDFPQQFARIEQQARSALLPKPEANTEASKAVQKDE
ncbi:MAG: cytochrome c biogenesis protein ResB [Burkholderiaceae bacterium]|nr:MAG: cytochrome c biogenesis protein ResB [Burkholderiaceae bacterium]